MSSLKTRDYEGILSFLRLIERVPDLTSFRELVVTGLKQLIPSDQAGYNEIDAGAGRLILIDLPEPFMSPEWGPILAEHLLEHPVIAYHRATKDFRALKISDFVSRTEFHRMTLYNEIYSKLGAEDQIAIGLPAPPSIDIGIAFNRSRNFVERDREVLDTVRPHLEHAYRNALDRSRLGNALETLSDIDRRGIVALDLDGSIALVTRVARRQFHSFFPDETEGTRLPEPLEAWVRSQRERLVDDDPAPPSVFSITRGDGRLRVRYLPTSSSGAPEILVLEDDLSSPIASKSLERLGLTRRQAEVLALVARGLGNAEIAEALDISHATVKKHLEGIYSRIGVSTRSEAIAVAYEANWREGP